MDNKPQNKKESFLEILFSTKCLALYLTIVHIFLTSGMSFGWNAIILLLKGEKKYYFLCTDNIDFENETRFCDEEQLYLTNLFTVAYTFQYISGLPIGLITDYLGPKCVIIGHLINMGSFLGLAYFTPSAEMIFDWNYLSLTLIFISRHFISTRYFHYANLFPNNFNLVSTLISTSSILSAGIPPIMYFIWFYYNISLQDILTTFVMIQSPLIISCIIQPRKPFKFGQKIYFSFKKFSIVPIENSSQKIEVSTSISQHQELQMFRSSEPNFQFVIPSNNTLEKSFGDNSKDSDITITNNHTNQEAHEKFGTSRDSIVQAEQISTHSFTIKSDSKLIPVLKKLKNELVFRLELIFVKLFLPTCIYAFWLIVFSIFLNGTNLILFQKSQDEVLSNVLTFIFSCLIPFGFVGSVSFAILGDLIDAKIMIIGYICIGLLHTAFVFLPAGYIFILTFLTYTFAEDLLFASQISLLSRYTPETAFCSVLGLFYTLSAILPFLAGRIVMLLISDSISWQVLYAIIIVIGFISLLISFKLKRYRI